MADIDPNVGEIRLSIDDIRPGDILRKTNRMCSYVVLIKQYEDLMLMRLENGKTEVCSIDILNQLQSCGASFEIEKQPMNGINILMEWKSKY